MKNVGEREANVNSIPKVLQECRSWHVAAASIWFEIWGVVDPGLIKSIFPGKFPKISISQAREIDEKFRFSRQNWLNISIFSGKLTKDFDFFQARIKFTPKCPFIQTKFAIYS